VLLLLSNTKLRARSNNLIRKISTMKVYLCVIHGPEGKFKQGVVFENLVDARKFIKKQSLNGELSLVT